MGLKQRGEKDKTPLLSHLPPFSSALSLVILAQAQCGDRLSMGSICEAGISAFSQTAGLTPWPGCKWSQNRFIPPKQPLPKADGQLRIFMDHIDH